MSYYAFKESKKNTDLTVYMNVTPSSFTITRAFDGKQYAAVEFDDSDLLMRSRLTELKEQEWIMFDNAEDALVFQESEDVDPTPYDPDIVSVKDSWGDFKSRLRMIDGVIRQTEASTLPDLEENVENYFKDNYKKLNNYIFYGHSGIIDTAVEDANTENGDWWNETSETAPNSPITVFVAALTPYVVE